MKDSQRKSFWALKFVREEGQADLELYLTNLRRVSVGPLTLAGTCFKGGHSVAG